MERSRSARGLTEERLARIRLLGLDLDGVLTDAGVWLDARGEEVKRFDVRDGHGLAALRDAGVILAIVTRGDRAIAEPRARKLGITHVLADVRDKGAALASLSASLGVAHEHVAFVGDDLPDLGAFSVASTRFAVADALAPVRRAADHVTAAKGGHGAVREVADMIIDAISRKRTSAFPRRRTRLAERMADGKTYVIAEIGQNHQGEMDIARELIQQAKLCGADAVKLQKRDVRSLLTPEEYDRPYESPHAFGRTYGEHRDRLELSITQHAELIAYAESHGLDCFASPWDLASVEALLSIDVPILKVPSAALTHGQMLRRMAKSSKPVLLSTGMSDLDEIDEAVRNLDGAELYVLQCTSAYPCSFDEVNLRAMVSLGARYGRPFGLSGHHKGIAVDAAAVALGARILERHFTLDRTWKGSDHAASLEPHGLHRLVRDVRAIEAALGSADKAVQKGEIAPRTKLRGARLRSAA